eukprot:Sspe_Gene.63161::Locus_35933_Transcript_1_1_Confidence_1.000_Length_2421::g.63161::m.63161
MAGNEVATAPLETVLGHLLNHNTPLSRELSGTFYQRAHEAVQKGKHLHEVGVLEQYIFKYLLRDDLRKVATVCRHWAMVCHLNPEVRDQLYWVPLVETWPEEWKEVWRTCFMSSDTTMLLRGVLTVRRWLSVRNPPIEEATKDRLMLRKLIKLLSHDDDRLRFESCWAVTNICSGESCHTQAAVEEGAVEGVLAHIITHNKTSVVEQGVWCLGNIAGDSPQMRDQVVRSGAVDVFLDLAKRSHMTSPTFRRNLSWAASGLCRGRVGDLLPTVTRLLPLIADFAKSSDAEVAVDALWASSFLSEEGSSQIQAVIDHGIVRTALARINGGCAALVIPSLRILKNIAAGDDGQIHAVIGGVPKIASLLDYPRKEVRRIACEALAGVVNGIPSRAQSLVECKCIPKVVSLSIADAPEVRKEAVELLVNVSSVPSLIPHLLQVGAVEALCKVITCMEERRVLCALQALLRILRSPCLDKSDTWNNLGFVNYTDTIRGCCSVAALRDVSSAILEIVEQRLPGTPT